jgi:hypothetical protein
MSPVRYEPGFYIPEDDILHSHCRGNLKSYIALTGWTLYWRRNVSPVKYELGIYIPEDDILQVFRSLLCSEYHKQPYIQEYPAVGMCSRHMRLGNDTSVSVVLHAARAHCAKLQSEASQMAGRPPAANDCVRLLLGACHMKRR